MAEEGFIDYFEFAGLNPGDSRRKNYDLLVKKHREKANKLSQQAKIDTAILSQAMGIFRDPERYDQYRAQWKQRQSRKADAGVADARRRDSRPAQPPPQPQPQPQEQPVWSASAVSSNKRPTWIKRRHPCGAPSWLYSPSIALHQRRASSDTNRTRSKTCFLASLFCSSQCIGPVSFGANERRHAG